MRTAIFAGLLACALVTPVFAADTESASLKLKTAPTAESFIHDGSAWRCAGDACTASKVRSLPAARACRKLAAQVGELTAFTYRGAVIEGDALADCNTAAKKG